MKDQFNHDHFLDKKLLNLIDNKDIKNNSALLDKIKKSFQLKDDDLNKLIPINSDFLYVQSIDHNSMNELDFSFGEDFEGKNIFFIFANPEDTFIYNQIKIKVQSNISIKALHLNQINKLKNSFVFNIEEGFVDVFVFSDIHEKQLLDESMEFIHDKPNTKSNIKYHSFVSGKIATQVNTKILQSSKHCESHQSLKHVSQKSGSTILSKPNLMIMNPDVVSSHGNSIGSISSEYLFYLQQRGVNKSKAINMIKKSEFLNIFEEDKASFQFLQLWENVYEK